MAYENIFDNFRSGIARKSILPNIFAAKHGGIGERIIDPGISERIYGTSDEFISSYKKFQDYYFELLSDSKNVRRSFSKNLNIEMMRKTGTIDLSLLNHSARQNAERMFAGGVLQLDKLMQNVGFPNLAFPTANPFRTPFKFEVDQNITHPAQVMLNRMIFNVDRTASSIADIRFGTRNLMSAEDLERNLYQIQKMKSGSLLEEGKKIITFDVETTGILPGSQVRSVSLAERTSLSGMTRTVQSFGFESERLGGLLAGPNLSDTLSSFISKQEGLGNLVRTEEDFLSNMKNVMKRLIEADQVTGHNVNFDINEMIKTMSGMKGFSSDKELVDLVGQFVDKKTSNKNFLIDTLEVGRAYVTEKAQSIIGTGGDPLTRGEQYIKRFFSTQSLADVRMGGKATYVGVENFAMNTNLLELMAEEQYAPEIFGKIFKGSHIAETDTILQDHILKYIHNKKLTFRDLHSAGQMNVSEEAIEIARKTVFKSSAITATTNIADPSFLTKTALNYVLSEEGLKGMSAVIGADDIVNSGLLAGTQNLDPAVKEAYIKYQGGKYKLFTGLGEEGLDINQDKAQSHLRALINSAKDSRLNKQISGLGSSYNPAEKNIINLGVSFLQNQNMELMQRTRGIAAGALDVRSYIDNVGMLYSSFADPLTLSQEKALFRAQNLDDGAFSAKMNFSAGLNSARNTAEEFISKHMSYAQAMLGSGNKYGFLGVRENVLSNIVSSATTGTASDIYGRAVSGGYADNVSEGILKSLKYAANSEIADVTSQIGIGHFLKQKSMILASQEGEAKKILLSYDYFRNLDFGNGLQMKNVLDERRVAVSLSLAQKADDSEILNLTWRAGRDSSGITSEQMAGKLYDDMMSDAAVKEIISSGKAELGEQVEMFRLTYQGMDRDEAVKSIARNIDERGIGIGYQEGVAVQRIKEGFARMGQDLASDAYDNLTMNIIGDIEDGLQTGALYDQKVIAASGSQAVLDDANASAVKNANAVAEELFADKSLLDTARKNLKSGRKQTSVSTAVEMYHAYKGKAGIAALGLTALVGGYYMTKRYKENQLYNETVEQQPYENSRQIDQGLGYARAVSSQSSYRRDPLVTAGVVGNLDRRKIGHTQMGNNKYNHLYGS
jgi:hypothetical protein